MAAPPPPTFGEIDLSNTRLHYLRCGNGPPLLMVPATVSLISQWLPLAQFMGQLFTTYFFELPGHGKSIPYPDKFDSRLVPGTALELMQAMGHETFNLIGFSFGGLLALRTLEALQQRIENVILISPFVGKQVLRYSSLRQQSFRLASAALKKSLVQRSAIQLMHNSYIERPLIYALSRFANIEESILESKEALKIPQSTLDVLAHTLDEIFSLDYDYPQKPFQHPCYFAMSRYDDLLDYNTTLEVVEQHFADLTTQTFTLPYHQPPEPPTFAWLNQEFGSFLNLLTPLLSEKSAQAFGL
jgi:pimeloyl-ACP methyl ester carboxylesterase